MPATSTNQASPPSATASVSPSRRCRSHMHGRVDRRAMMMPTLTGAITTLRKRLTSSSAGCSAKAALPGLGLLARAAGAERIARAPPLGQEPERRHQRPRTPPGAAAAAARRTTARARRAPRNGQTSGRSSAAGEAEVERVVAAAVEVALERPQHERREQRLGVAERGVAHELEAREQRERGEDAGERAVPAAADQPARHPEGHHAGRAARRRGRSTATGRAPRRRRTARTGR